MTNEPVTTSGWYEHADGTIGRYAWVNGSLKLCETVACWDATTSEEERIRANAAAEATEVHDTDGTIAKCDVTP